MFKIGKKSLIKRALFAVVGACLASVSIFTIIKSVNNNSVDAATNNGGSVSISQGAQIAYGTWTTNIFNISSGGGSFKGMCADPQAPSPGSIGSTANLISPASNDNNVNNYNTMKLMLYLFFEKNGGNNNFIDGMFQITPDYNTRYAYVHAIIGYLNSGSLAGLDAGEQNWVRTASAQVQNLIALNTADWQAARQYNLYLTNSLPSQRIAWIEYAGGSGPTPPQPPEIAYGNIVVTKQDSETSSSTPQGDATFSGISFALSGNGISQTCTLGSSSSCGFYMLPEGSYTVSETSTNASYPVKVTGNQTASISSNGQTVNLVFKNTAQKGNVTVNKIDAETGSCTAVAELTLSGTQLQLINNSRNPVYYGGRNIAKGAVIDTKTVGNDCKVTFNNLPYGTYTVKEVAAATGYVLTQQTYDVTIPSSGALDVSTTVPNQVIRGDLKFKKMDATNNKVMPDAVFSIARLDANKNIKEIHIVVTDQNGVIDTSSNFILHTINTNGYDLPYNNGETITFQGNGSWFGIDNNGQALPVNDGLGALHYGTYLIQELRCDANFFCFNIINQHKTVTIDHHNQVLDLGDWDNDCWKFDLGTTATDIVDGDQFIEASGQVTITDAIDYCVKPNTDFVIEGILMDKSTGQPLLVNGQTVENKLNLNSAVDCGTVDMTFTFDASALAGKDIVVFEYLYYQNRLITSHEDINDQNQTVTIIELKTYAVNSATGDKVLPKNEDVEVKDTVTYCLRPGIEYTIKGIMMDKSTGSELLINGQPVESDVTFTPVDACGTIDMFFTFNTSGFSGAELVIFESLYDVNGNLILEHKDINNADETVTIEPDVPVPNTGAFGKTNGGVNESYVIVSLAGAIIIMGMTYYVAYRKKSHKVDFVRK